MFIRRAGLERHVEAGAKHVILSAPIEGGDVMKAFGARSATKLRLRRNVSNSGIHDLAVLVKSDACE